MMNRIVLSVLGLLVLAATASAQVRPADVECKKSETQPECFARLKCKADEELEACQKRLLKCTANESLADCEKRVGAANGNNGNAGNQNRGNDGGRNGNDNGRNGDDRGRNGDDGGRNGDDRGRNGDDRNDRGDNGDRNRDNGRQRGESDRDNRDRDDSRRGGRSRGERRRSGGGKHDFEANKTFGLGLELGEPTGLNGKYFVSKSGAIDFGAGYIYRSYYYDRGEGLHLYGDYLFHPVSLASTPSLELPFYVGVGLRYWDFNYCFQGLCNYRGSAVGIRVPLGIAFDFNNVPLDIFVQLTPVLDFLSGGYYDRFRNREHLGIDFSVGIRFWFK